MSLTSWAFLLFSLVLMALYYTVFKNKQYMIVLIANIVFFASMSWRNLLLLFLIITVAYNAGIFLNNGGVLLRKIILWCSISVCLGILCFFKFVSPFTELLHNYNPGISAWSVILPIGLSFYVFQMVGYVVDVYRGEIQPEKNFIVFATCASYFPHILQGPIGKYGDLIPQFKKGHTFDYDRAIYAVTRIFIGFFKKLVVANRIAMLIDPVYTDFKSYSGAIWIFCIVLYAFQLYADFSGYMDIIIGTSKLLGIELTENFDTPYFSKSVAEYWRRWHISLGEWFRNYLFYPLLRTGWIQNLRKSLKKKNKYLSTVFPNVISLTIVWFLIGLWHGSTLNFIVYGLFHGFFMICDSALRPQISKWREKHEKLSESVVFNVFRVVRTFVIVCFGYFFFRANSLHESLYVIGNSIPWKNIGVVIGIVLNNKFTVLCIGLGIIAVVVLDVMTIARVSIYDCVLKMHPFIRCSMYIVGVFCIILLGYFGKSSFIYFGF